jgi:hypothetical protein
VSNSILPRTTLDLLLWILNKVDLLFPHYLKAMLKILRNRITASAVDGFHDRSIHRTRTSVGGNGGVRIGGVVSKTVKAGTNGIYMDEYVGTVAKYISACSVKRK